MTREEQLDWLCRLRSEIYVYMPKEWLIPMNNALDMAIKALKQEACVDATNGQVLLQMFPPSVYFGDDEKHIVLLTKDCELTCYNNEWWNAKYKADKGDKE